MNKRTFAVGISTLVACAATLYFHGVVGTDIIFPHLYYLPIILAAIGWGRRSWFLTAFLCAFLLASHVISGIEASITSDLARAATFLLVGGIVAELSRARRQAGEALLQASYRHQAVILESMLDAVIVANPDGTIRTLNRAALELLGYAEEELIGQPVGTVFEEEEEEEEEEEAFFRGTGLARLLREGAARDVEMTLLAKSGERIPVVFNGSVIREEDGRLSAVVGVARDIRERKRVEETLYTLNTAAVAIQRAARSPEAVFTAVMEQLQALGFAGVVLLLDETREQFTIRYMAVSSQALAQAEKLTGLKAVGYTFPVKQLPFGRQILAGEAVFVPDAVALLAPVFPTSMRPLLPTIIRLVGTPLGVAAPLSVKGEIIGLLGVSADRLTEADVPTVTAFANQMAAALENARLFEAEQRRRQELEGLQATTASITAMLDLENLLRMIVKQGVELFKAPAASLMLWDEREENLTIRASWGLSEEYVQKQRIPRERVYAAATPEGEFLPVITPDVRQTPFGQLDLIEKERLCTVLSAPLVKSGQPVGVLNIYSRNEPREFTSHEIRLAGTLADQAAIAIENALLFEEVQAAREQLRDLASYLQATREEERARIAREIHDEFGQVLTALKMDLSWLAKRLPEEQSDLREKTDTMSDLVDTTIQTVRHVITELRPGLLDDLGLAAAIEWQAQEFAERMGIDCELHLSDEDIVLHRDLATAIFRIFQETLTNVARHAEASKVIIELEDRPDELVLVIRDNGKGITESQVSDPKSLGLVGMRERAISWGGAVTFQGVPGQGTTVTVWVPIVEEVGNSTLSLRGTK